MTAHPTRQEYMSQVFDGSQKITHRDYYAAVLRTAGVKLHSEHELVVLSRDSTDPYFNDVPMDLWDLHGMAALPALSRAFKEHGDFASMAGLVCCMKEAARQVLEEERSNISAISG